MPLRAGKTRWILSLFLKTFLGAFAISPHAQAQTLQPKAVQPTLPQQTPIPPPPAQSQSSQPQPSPPPQWAVGCTNTPSEFNCSAGQTLVYQQGASRLQVSAVVQIAPETKKPSLVLILPLGINLPNVVTVQFGGVGAKVLPFQT